MMNSVFCAEEPMKKYKHNRDISKYLGQKVLNPIHSNATAFVHLLRCKERAKTMPQGGMDAMKT